MRETRLSGSEGGVGHKPHPYPYYSPTVARVREGYLGKQDEKTRNLEEVASV